MIKPSSVAFKSLATMSHSGDASQASLSEKSVWPFISSSLNNLTPSIWWNAGKCDASISSLRYTSPVHKKASWPWRRCWDWCADVCVLRSSVSVR